MAETKSKQEEKNKAPLVDTADIQQSTIYLNVTDAQTVLDTVHTLIELLQQYMENIHKESLKGLFAPFNLKAEPQAN